MRKVCAVIVMGVIAMTSAGMDAWAAVPPLINYQGVLLDDLGDPVADPTTIDFAIWDDPNAGNELWRETREVTPDENGVFNILLGAVTPVPSAVYDGPDIYLSLQVQGEAEMQPRARLVTVPFSGRVQSVDGASGGTVTGPLVIDGGGKADQLRNPAAHEVCPTAGLTVNTTACFRDVVGIDIGQRIQAEEHGGVRILGSQGDTPDMPAIGFFSTDGINDGGGGNGIYRPLANTMAFATADTERVRIMPHGNVGIGTPSPTSKLHVTGPVATGITRVTGNTTLQSAASIVLADNSAGVTTITLPGAAHEDGRRLTIKKISTVFDGNVVIEADTGDLIDGLPSIALTTEHECVELVRGDGEWFIVSWFFSP